MSVKVTQRVNLTKLIDENIVLKLEEFEQAVLDEVTVLSLRTLSGQGSNNRPFMKYDDSTIEQKKKKGKQTNPVNLTDTGDMLNGVVASFSKTKNAFRAEIGFNTKEQSKKAFWTDQLRPWFKLSRRQVKNIRERIQQK